MKAEFVIEDDVPAPRSKTRVKRETKEQTLFNAYAIAYSRCYLRKPVLIQITPTGMFKVDTMPQAVSARRLKELTNMLKERAKDL